MTRDDSVAIAQVRAAIATVPDDVWILADIALGFEREQSEDSLRRVTGDFTLGSHRLKRAELAVALLALRTIRIEIS